MVTLPMERVTRRYLKTISCMLMCRIRENTSRYARFRAFIVLYACLYISPLNHSKLGGFCLFSFSVHLNFKRCTSVMARVLVCMRAYKRAHTAIPVHLLGSVSL